MRKILFIVFFLPALCIAQPQIRANQILRDTTLTGTAANALRVTIPVAGMVGNSGKVLSTNGSSTSWISATPSLTATQVGFGSASNFLTGSNQFEYRPTDSIFHVNTAGNASRIFLNGTNSGAIFFVNLKNNPVIFGQMFAGGFGGSMGVNNTVNFDDATDLVNINSLNLSLTGIIGETTVNGVLKNMNGDGVATWQDLSDGLAEYTTNADALAALGAGKAYILHVTIAAIEYKFISVTF
jgi:hypothetical protein